MPERGCLFIEEYFGELPWRGRGGQLASSNACCISLHHLLLAQTNGTLTLQRDTKVLVTWWHLQEQIGKQTKNGVAQSPWFHVRKNIRKPSPRSIAYRSRSVTGRSSSSSNSNTEWSHQTYSFAFSNWLWISWCILHVWVNIIEVNNSKHTLISINLHIQMHTLNNHQSLLNWQNHHNTGGWYPVSERNEAWASAIAEI